MRHALLFLHGKYTPSDVTHYKSLCRGKFLVAVDGGYQFFRKAGLIPDLLIGDFDSIGKMPRDLSAHTAIVRHPAAKNKTDIELAVDYCLEKGIREIQIIQPSFGEPDQFVGNLMLLTRAVPVKHRCGGCCIHILNREYQICGLIDGSGVMIGGRGDGLSIVPVSNRIVLTLTGTEYDVANLSLGRGESRALRNRIVSNRVTVRVRGTALVMRQFSGTKARKSVRKKR